MRALHIILTVLVILSCTFGTLAQIEVKPVFVHTVYFWLSEDATSQQKAAFEVDLRSLEEIDVVRAMWVGEPAGTPRDVVDNSYDYALIVHFADRAAHDAYQTHPVHLAAVKQFEGVVERIQVYDTLVEK